jgi:hypothetical protein
MNRFASSGMNSVMKSQGRFDRDDYCTPLAAFRLISSEKRVDVWDWHPMVKFSTEVARITLSFAA